MGDLFKPTRKIAEEPLDYVALYLGIASLSSQLHTLNVTQDCVLAVFAVELGADC